MFSNIPHEVYGIIINYMDNPLNFGLINQEYHKFIHESPYGKCYYKIFKLRLDKNLFNVY